jgi:hypothetical protein
MSATNAPPCEHRELVSTSRGKVCAQCRKLIYGKVLTAS